MSIYSVPFSVYERLASAKMNAFEAAINAHTHDGTYGVKIPFSYIDGSIAASQFIANTINGNVIIDGTLSNEKIEDGSITMTQINNNVLLASSLKLSNDGYAVYAP
jgi:hypothetical protein